MKIQFDESFASAADFARLYRSLGLQVVPAKSPNESKVWKRPSLSSWREWETTLTPDSVFESWYGPTGAHVRRSNLGLITGSASNGVFVVDIDLQRNATAQSWLGSLEQIHGDQFKTPTQRTGGGGLQLLFRAPEGWVAPTAKTSIGVDIRGQGGFAVLAPSLHDSGRQYQWLQELEPWNMPIMQAPKWLCEAIEQVVREWGGGSEYAGQGPAERTESPEAQRNEFGMRVDGREDYMTRLVWGRVLDLYRVCPIIPTEEELQQSMRDGFQIYERQTKSRLFEPGTPNHILLEREGRGQTLFQQKFRAALRLWDTKVAAEAMHMPARAQNAPQAVRFDPATGEIVGPVNLQQAHQQSDTFELLDVKAIKALPPEQWAIEQVVPLNGLGYIFGPPGCGKSFISLGMSLAFASGQKTWHNRQVHVQGPVIYISPEGVADQRNRIQAWEQHWGIKADDLPFYLVRQVVDFMQPGEIDKLLRTIKLVADQQKINPVMIVIDTVSRSLPGSEENEQSVASLWVRQTDAIRDAFGCFVLGLHHTNRLSTNMRGSSVFDGAADLMLEVIRESGQEIGKIKAAKIKAGADGWEENFQLKKVQTGNISGAISLVALPTTINAEINPDKSETAITSDVEVSILKAIRLAWDKGVPWSTFPRSRLEGRYAPAQMETWGLDKDTSLQLLEGWMMKGTIEIATVDSHSKTRGLRVKIMPFIKEKH